MRRVPLLAAAAAAVVAAVLGPAAAAAASDGIAVAEGHDVSYPQCGRTLPGRGDLAVVGVNAGTGRTTNPCLAQQLSWGDAPGPDGVQRRADVYVNTANPGHLGGWWPEADRTRAGRAVRNPAGSCGGAEDAPCAYVYGWSVAAEDLHRGVPDAGARTWWLDVETMNTWSWDRRANRAVLEGMTDALQDAGLRVGLYSTRRQWSSIVGDAPGTSTLAGLPSWLAGATTRGGARANCRAAPLTPGGSVLMAQWLTDGLDHDTACRAAVAGTRPQVRGDAFPGGWLEADPGRWGPGGVALQVQWLRDGEPVGPADAAAYMPTASDVGARIAVRVTGSRPGQPRLTLTGPARTIAPVPAGEPVSTDGSAETVPPGPPGPAAPTAPPQDVTAQDVTAQDVTAQDGPAAPPEGR